MLEKTDESLMLDVQNGNLAAMGVLFERYEARLYNFILRMLGDRTASKDLTQQLFVRAIQYRMSYRVSQGGVNTWLYRMAVNLCTDYRKQQHKGNESTIALTEHHESYSAADTAYGEAEYSALERALLELNEEQKQVLVLSKFQSMPYDEIAAIMDLSVANVKVKVHRALAALRIIYFKKTV